MLLTMKLMLTLNPSPTKERYDETISVQMALDNDDTSDNTTPQLASGDGSDSSIQTPFDDAFANDTHNHGDDIESEISINNGNLQWKTTSDIQS